MARGKLTKIAGGGGLFFKPPEWLERVLARRYRRHWKPGLPSIERLKPGDIILTGERGHKISFGIRAVTDCPYSHSILYAGEGKGIHTTIGGTKHIDLKKELYEKIQAEPQKHYAAAYRIKGLTPEKAGGMLEFARKHVGKRPYDYLQLGWLWLTYSLGLRKIFNATVLKRAWVCTELITRAAKSQGIKLHDWLHESEFAPKDLALSKYLQRIKPK